MTPGPRAAERPVRSAAGPPALVAGALLLFSGLAALVLTPGSSDLQEAAPAVPVAIGAPPVSPSAERAQALALARGRDPLGPRLLQSVTLRPASSGAGLVIAASSDQTLLDEAGLKVGDRLLESDQKALGPSDVGLLSDQFASLDSVELTLERDDRLRLMTVDLTR